MKNKINYIHFESVDSTNTYLKENYNNFPNFTVVSTDYQSKGKGRLGRTWLSSPKENLMMSILIKENIDSNLSYSELAGAAIYLALKEIGIESKIKWPNDIVINNKKICGILCEAISDNEGFKCIIIGIGLNVKTKEFAEEIASKATSIYLETNIEYDINKLKMLIANKVYEIINNKIDYLAICKENSNLINKEIIFTKDSIECKGIVKDLLNNGNLLVLYKDKLIELYSGEVTLTKNY